MDRVSYEELDALAVEAGTDKSSEFHDYMDAYAQVLAPFRDRSVKVLEIGLYQGSSARLWENYFRRAELHFVDISMDAVKYQSGHSQYHLVDQNDPSSLEMFLQEVGGDFDIIIDDGNHTAKGQLTSFQILFPALKSKGIYIVEDLHSSYWAGAGFGSTIAYLKQLIDDINYVGARTGCASKRKINPQIQSELYATRTQIRSLTFFSSLVIVEKQ